MGILVQCLGTAVICSMCACMGIMFTWPSCTLRLFESSNTTLHRPMTETELALFGSLSSIGALLGTPAFGFMLDTLGRKRCSLIAGVTSVIAWVIIATTNLVETILFSVFLSGIAGSSFLVVTVYVSEICQESVRGTMCAGVMTMYGIGMLISYLMGGLLSYDTMTYVCLSLSAVTTAFLIPLKESPSFLMSKGRENEAAKSLAFYRSLSPTNKEVLEEMAVIRRTLNPEMDDATPEEQKLTDLEKPVEKPKKLGFFQFLRKSASTRKAFLLTFIMVTTSIFQGMVVIQVYAEPLFEEAIPSMSATLGTVIMATVGVASSILSGYLTEVIGRRPLMIYGSLGTALSCVFLGLQIHLKWGPNWLIAVNLYVFNMLYTLGEGMVPYVLIAEVFLPEVKSMMSMLVIEWTWFCNSVVLFIFNPLVNAIGLGPVFYLFAGVGVFSGVYCFFMMPETKGLAVDEIQVKFRSRKNKSNGIY